jgi:hypothetical protein
MTTPPPPLDLSQLRGLNSRFKSYPASNLPAYTTDSGTRATIQPDLCGMKPVDWLLTIQQGIVPAPLPAPNALTLNLDPSHRLAQPDLSITATTWNRYKKSIFGFTNFSFLKRVQERIDLMGYTVAQRNDLLVKFLMQLEAGIAKGSLTSRTPFFVHQRNYIDAQSDQDEFVADMATFIRKVARNKNADLINWIAGIRLGEHNQTDMVYFQNALIYIATEINARTNDWLKGRAFIANGGSLGMLYTGWNSAAATTDFYNKIKAQTASFALGYKFMEAGKSLDEIMEKNDDGSPRDCGGHACVATSEVDWKYYIRTVRGLDDFFSEANASAFPLHSSMIFVGDSGDATKTLVSGHDSTMMATVRYSAINGILEAHGFAGKLFMMPFSAIIDYDPGENTDAGKFYSYTVGTAKSSNIWDWTPTALATTQASTSKVWNYWPVLAF